MKIIEVRKGYKYGFENVKVLGGNYRNFGGEKRKYNEEGKRNFNIIIDPEWIPMVESWGVKVRYFPKTEEDDPMAIPTAHVKINVNYKAKTRPYIERVTDKWRQEIQPEKLGRALDEAIFENVDLVCTLYRYEDSVSLYLQEGHFKLLEDPITSKYDNIPVLGEDEEAPFSEL